MSYPMPTLESLKKARREFEVIEPRDFFYWSVTKLVSSIMVEDTQAIKIDELVIALMMLLTTWNKNFYRFFERRKPNMTFQGHFTELEDVIKKHFNSIIKMRKQTINEIDEAQLELVQEIFRDFTDTLGRVGAAKCLHLLAPYYFPLWDARILQGYGLEKGKFRHVTDVERYIEFIQITKEQLDFLGNLGNLSNPLKSLDEYNYCRFTRNVSFD